MELIGKLFGLGVVIIVADKIVAEGGRKDIAFYITLAGVVIGLTMVIPKITRLFDTVTTMFNF